MKVETFPTFFPRKKSSAKKKFENSLLNGGPLNFAFLLRREKIKGTFVKKNMCVEAGKLKGLEAK